MASGFIILRDGRCLSVRHAIHDSVLRSIASVLIGAPLGEWLGKQVPIDTDVELGYAFVRAANGEHVSRELDTRALTESNQELFKRAAREARPIAEAYAPLADVESALNRLRKMLDLCDEGRPPLELSDWTAQAPPCEKRTGPGWIESA